MTIDITLLDINKSIILLLYNLDLIINIRHSTLNHSELEYECQQCIMINKHFLEYCVSRIHCISGI